MWRPPQRIKHELPSGDWPTAEQAAASRLMSPATIGPMPLSSRTWVPAMVPWRATEGGLVTPDVLAWYERFARGKPGAIVVEATGIRDVPSGPLLRIGHDRFTPGLRQLVDTVHRASQGETRVLIQIIDFLRIRRRPDPAKFFARFLTITDRHRAAYPEAHSDDEVRAQLALADPQALAEVLTARELEALQFGARERVTDTELPHIAELPKVLPELFAAAAGRAATAGFDGVELHYAHAYTMASFLSRHNTRSDGYGGDVQRRLRLPLEVFAAVRARVGDDVCVGCRFLADEAIAGGSDLDEAKTFARAFAAAGMDFVSLSRGGKFEDALPPKVGWAVYPYTGPSGYECMPIVRSDEAGPFGRNVAPGASVRAALAEAGFATPVVVTGGICSFSQAEGILARGEADVIGAARQTLADPDWFLKIATGCGEAIRRCKYTNYCEALDQKHKVVTCQLWDREALDAPDVPLSADGRRRLVAPPWRR
ncbi:MAG: NADH:flavin oxidoreductase [Nannocystaceae bacterium]|nr:NADH:flavin oxidoreductase [Nannocystaceae bacterium]